jgi:DnaJ-class molecular chaperone
MKVRGGDTGTLRPLCDKCSGAGQVIGEDARGPALVKCAKCDGRGRL